MVTLGSKCSPGNSPILSLPQLKLDAAQNHSSISVGLFALELQPISLEYIVATFQALEQDLQDFLLDPSLQLSSSPHFSEIVYYTLDLTQNRAAINPLLIIQPSFLVRWGHPKLSRYMLPTSFYSIYKPHSSLPTSKDILVQIAPSRSVDAQWGSLCQLHC
jgi:hypothetical protein